MRKHTRESGGADRQGGTRRLRELALEASERLDSVLVEGEGSRAVQELVVGAAGGASSRPVRRPVGQTSAAEAPSAGDRRSPRALVSHVSPGVARTLANILRSLGLRSRVACTPEELDLDPEGFGWDVIFLQGAPMPYPGSKLVAATLERWAGSDIPFVLLRRAGEAPIPAASSVGASTFLEWPFERGDVNRQISNLLQGSR